MSLNVTLQIGEPLWNPDGTFVSDATGYAVRCSEVTEVTFLNQIMYDKALITIRGNRVVNGLDPDTGLPPE